MRFHLILSLVGIIIAFFGMSFIIPIITGLLLGEKISDIFFMFIFPMILCILGGGFLYYYFHTEEDIRNREAFVLVPTVWIFMVIVGAFPYIVSERLGLMSYEMGVFGAIFESMSGLSTTGATMLEVPENKEIINQKQYAEGYFDAPKSLLLWRSETQWLGGMGIIVLATIIFSRLFGGGVQVLQAEMPGTGITRLKPQMAQTARLLWSLYFALTFLEVVLLFALTEMPLYDSICNSFSTVSTGGFSPKIESIGSYDDPVSDLIITLFMFVSGINFVILYYVFNYLIRRTDSFSKNLKSAFKVIRDNDEFKVYCFLVFICFFAIFLNRTLLGENLEYGTNFRYTLFQTVSLLTGTGFTTTDYMTWPNLSIFILFSTMFMGGCAGSTTGGIKMVRIMLLFKALKREMFLVIHPRAIIKLRIGGKVLDEDLFRNVGVFFFIFMILFVGGSFIVLYLEPSLDLIDGVSVSLSCLANIGPGLGAIGPSTTYYGFSDATLLFLSALMMLGRLEIITVLLLFFPDTYRD